MGNQTILNKILLLIAAVTAIGGLLQMLLPGVALHILEGDTGASSRRFFAIVGMFMLIVGGLLWQAVRQGRGLDLVCFWSMLQKFGATFFVTLSVFSGLLSTLALPVAAFDLLSGLVLGYAYWQYRQSP